MDDDDQRGVKTLYVLCVCLFANLCRTKQRGLALDAKGQCRLVLWVTVVGVCRTTNARMRRSGRCFVGVAQNADVEKSWRRKALIFYEIVDNDEVGLVFSFHPFESLTSDELQYWPHVPNLRIGGRAAGPVGSSVLLEEKMAFLFCMTCLSHYDSCHHLPRV